MQQYFLLQFETKFQIRKKNVIHIYIIDIIFFVFSVVFCEYIVFFIVCVCVSGKKRAIDPSQRKKRTQTSTFQADTK
jgi:hypothetical protein